MQVGQLLVSYLAYVRSFRQYLEWSVLNGQCSQTKSKQTSSEVESSESIAGISANGKSNESARQRDSFKLWEKDGKPWSTSLMTKILIRETGKRLGIRLTVQDYCHIAIGISRKHVRGLIQESKSESEQDQDEEEDVHDLQAGHTSGIADTIYGLRSDILRQLIKHSIAKFRAITRQWQGFLGLASTKRDFELSERKRKASRDSTVIVKKQRLQWAWQIIEERLQILLGPGAQFKSEEQEVGSCM